MSRWEGGRQGGESTRLLSLQTYFRIECLMFSRMPALTALPFTSRVSRRKMAREVPTSFSLLAFSFTDRYICRIIFSRSSLGTSCSILSGNLRPVSSWMVTLASRQFSAICEQTCLFLSSPWMNILRQFLCSALDLSTVLLQTLVSSDMASSRTSAMSCFSSCLCIVLSMTSGFSSFSLRDELSCWTMRLLEKDLMSCRLGASSGRLWPLLSFLQKLLQSSFMDSFSSSSLWQSSSSFSFSSSQSTSSGSSSSSIEWRLRGILGELLMVEAWQVRTVCMLLILLGRWASLRNCRLFCEWCATSCFTSRTSFSSNSSFPSSASFSRMRTSFSLRRVSHSLISFRCSPFSDLSSSMRSLTCVASFEFSLRAFSSLMVDSRVSRDSQSPILSSSNSILCSSSSILRRTSASSRFLLLSRKSSSCMRWLFSLHTCREFLSWLMVSLSSEISTAWSGSGERGRCGERGRSSRSAKLYLQDMGYFFSKASWSWRCEGDLKELQEGGLFLGERQGEWQLSLSGKSQSGDVFVQSFLIIKNIQSKTPPSLLSLFCNNNLNTKMSLSEIGAMEDLMKIALTGQQHVDALIGYYRAEIDRYNDERAEWALHYEILKDNASNRYTLQQEIDQSRHRINDREGALNATKASLNKERQRYFEMLESSQAVKARLEENKQKFRDLVAACKPITVSKGRVEKKSGSSHNSSRLSASEHQGKGEIELELINLGKQHDARRTALQRQIDALKEELDSLISEHSRRGSSCSKEYKQALEGLADSESKIMQLTSEYFKLRMNSYEEERRTQEENEILRLKAVALAKKLQMLRDTHSQEFKSVDREVKQRNKEFRERYDEELRKKEEHLTLLKEQNEKINHIYLLKLKKLEGELKDVTERQRSIEDKSRSEISSLRGQIRIFRGRLEYEGVREMRAEMAAGEDSQEESSDTLSMSELQNLNREVEALRKKI